jgi:hypothetical protein
MAVRNILEVLPRTNYGEIVNVNGGLLDWVPVEGAPGNFIKVLTLDRKRHRVDFLFKQAPNGSFPKHNHRCIAVAYTLEGLWGYREGSEMMFPGCFGYEPAGTIHTPYASDQGMVVYSSFQGTDDVMLELLDDGDRVVGDIRLDFFEQHKRD